jgi:hypothetical protein
VKSLSLVDIFSMGLLDRSASPSSSAAAAASAAVSSSAAESVTGLVGSKHGMPKAAADSFMELSSIVADIQMMKCKIAVHVGPVNYFISELSPLGSSIKAFDTTRCNNSDSLLLGAGRLKGALVELQDLVTRFAQPGVVVGVIPQAELLASVDGISQRIHQYAADLGLQDGLFDLDGLTGNMHELLQVDFEEHTHLDDSAFTSVFSGGESRQSMVASFMEMFDDSGASDGDASIPVAGAGSGESETECNESNTRTSSIQSFAAHHSRRTGTGSTENDIMMDWFDSERVLDADRHLLESDSWYSAGFWAGHGKNSMHGSSHWRPMFGAARCKQNTHEWTICVEGSHHVVIGVAGGDAASDRYIDYRLLSGAIPRQSSFFPCWAIALFSRAMYFSGEYVQRDKGPFCFKLPCEVIIKLDCDGGLLSFGVVGQMETTRVCCSIPRQLPVTVVAGSGGSKCRVKLTSYCNSA